MENRDIEYFDNLWNNSKPKDGMKHNKETWDHKANGYLTNRSEQAKNNVKDRIISVVQYLESRGALTDNSTVVDLGCGPGRYAASLAKKAKKVIGIDISPVMLNMAKEYADTLSIDNVEFIETDFMSQDIEANGWDNYCDLLFASLTPAVCCYESLKKISKMSRGYVFNSSFVIRQDSLKNAILTEVLGKPPSNTWGNSSVYCMFNILWQMGYQPELIYRDERTDTLIPCTYEVAYDYATGLIHDETQAQKYTDEIFKYLKSISKDGMLNMKTHEKFAWQLWNVNERNEIL